MMWFKRIFLFMALNILVMVTISTVLALLGVKPYLTAYGMDYASLAIFCLVWGFGGAFISLALSRVMAKWMMGVKIIDPNTMDTSEQSLLQTVHRLAQTAGLSTMPQVGVYESPEVNAFATGPTRNRSLVAVSSGLLSRMDRDAVEGVLGHEVAHIANGDMVTMTLLQGIVNAFVMFFARVIAFAISQALRSRDEEGRGLSPIVQYVVVILLEMVLMVFGTMLVAWFSRWREFRADRGGADLAGRGKMIRALQSLERMTGLIDTQTQTSVQTLKISGKSSRWLRLFASHPPLSDRIARLEATI